MHAFVIMLKFYPVAYVVDIFVISPNGEESLNKWLSPDPVHPPTSSPAVWSWTQNSLIQFFLCWLFMYRTSIAISRWVWSSHPWAIWNIRIWSWVPYKHIFIHTSHLLNTMETWFQCLNIHFWGQQLHWTPFQLCTHCGYSEIQDGRHWTFVYIYIYLLKTTLNVSHLNR